PSSPPPPPSRFAPAAGAPPPTAPGGGTPNGRGPGLFPPTPRPRPPPHLIRIDIDPAEMRRLVPHAGIVADADAGSRALLAAVRGLRDRKGATKAVAAANQARANIAAAKAAARAASSKVQPQLAYLDAIRQVLPREGLLVIEVSQIGFTSYFGFPVY